jgi:tetratricopeptide (TPR) repeat protein
VETVPAFSRARVPQNPPKSGTRPPASRDGGATPGQAPRVGVPAPAAKGHAADHADSTLLSDAARAYSADRYQDALRILRRLSSQSPNSAPVRELLGLTLYRLGRWPLAVRELQAHHERSGSYDQFPVIADCYRAMRRYPEADEVWTSLRQASPSAEVVAEGRLVAAGCLADKGDMQGAVSLLESSLRRSKPKLSHLRQWYALADLYERAGDLPRARDLFNQIAAVDPDAYDVRQRLIALG